MPDLKNKKSRVQHYYDTVGWKQDNDGSYFDVVKFEDDRAIVQDYMRQCRLRLGKYLKSSGKYFFDIGCGPILYAEYLDYSREFKTRVCVDISFVALQEARNKLKNRGFYVVADATKLPFKDNIADAATCLNAIYHIPKDEQTTAIEQIRSILKTGSSAIIVYSWGANSILSKIAILPIRIISALYRRLILLLNLILGKNKGAKPKESTDRSQDPPKTDLLYFFSHPYRYFSSGPQQKDFDIHSFMSLDRHFTKIYIREKILGKEILDFIFWLEGKFPRVAGKIGQFPLFVITKDHA